MWEVISPFHNNGKMCHGGRCVFVDLPRRIDVYPDAPVCNPTLVGLESLRAVLLMASLSDLSKQDREDLFYRNALRLLRIQDT